MQAVEGEDTHAPRLSSDPGTYEEGETQKSSPEVTEQSAVKYFSLRLKSAQRNASGAEGPKKTCAQREIRKDNLQAQEGQSSDGSQGFPLTAQILQVES